MARRRGGEATLSLFAFQDIITGVAGVMLFILMLLVVQLALPAMQRPAEPTTQPDSAVASSSPAALASADDVERLNEMRAELERLRQQSKTLREIAASDPDQTLAQRQSELQTLRQKIEDLENDAQTLRQSAASIDGDADAKLANERLEKLQQSIETTQSELDQWSSGDFIAFRPAAAGTSMWMADVRGDSAEVFDLAAPGNIEKIQLDASADAEAIARLIAGVLERQSAPRRLVLVARPSIAGKLSELLEAFRERGYEIALELLDTGRRVRRAED